MLNIFKKNSTNEKLIKVECDEQSIKINNVEISFPIHLNTLKGIFGEPSKQVHDLLWRVVWDDIGFSSEYGSWNNILNIKFFYSKHHQIKHFPNKLFKGDIYINGELMSFNNFESVKLHKNQVSKLTYKEETKPYAISIHKNYSYKEEIPKDKYLIKQVENPIVFTDFGFKLSIIQELMYRKELLQPKFELYDFVKWYDKRKIDIKKEGYEPIEDVTQYFKDLQIPKNLATEITEIYQDGGNEVYLQLLRFGEGWEDYWDIETAVDANQFPNLKKAVLCYATENVFVELNEMGIDAKSL